jgi:hypothetical protein
MLAPQAPHSIRIQPGRFGDGFDVEVIPPLQEGPNHDHSFATYKSARSYVGGLRLVLGFPFVELCCEEADGAR